MSINSKTNKFSSVRGINPSFINVRNVKIPRKIQVKEDKMIQLKHVINNLYEYSVNLYYEFLFNHSCWW